MVNSSVGAIDGDEGGVAFPFDAFAYVAPLYRCAAKGDARKAIAFRKGSRAEARHAVGDVDARKARATIEGIKGDARHTAIRGNNTIFTSEN